MQMASMAPVLALPLLLAAAASPRPGPGDTCDPAWISTFGSYPGSSAGSVVALAVFDSGSGPELYAGGGFLGMGVPASRIARWNGERWAEVGGGVAFRVESLRVFDDGSGPALFVAGGFSAAGGQPAANIARWDGASWSPLGAGLDAPAYALAVHEDGTGPALYVGGSFQDAGGVPAAGIARWDGASWSAVGSGVSGLGASVRALAVHDDGSGPALYAGGSFTAAGAAPAANLARWDGSAWSEVGGGANAPIYALASEGPGVALYAGGDFTQAGGLPALRVARWSAGTWSALGSGMNDRVWVLGLHDDGGGGGPELVAGGRFSSAGGVAADSIARWNGASWSGMGAGLGGGLSDGGRALATYDDGSGAQLFVGGTFTAIGAETLARHIARWDGSHWLPLTSGLVSTVDSVALFDDGSGAGPAVHAAGLFDPLAQGPRGVARWSGSEWELIDPNTSYFASRLIVHDDGSGPALFVGGEFSGLPGNSIAKWDGASWSPLGSGLDAGVLALHVHDDGNGPALYVGGKFTTAGGIPAAHVAKWDGTSWSALGSGTSQRVRALCSYEIGGRVELVAGGDFTGAGGQSALHVARWDGLSWRNILGGTNQPVRALSVFDDGTGEALYVGGEFQIAGGQAADYVARWSPSAGWSPVGGGVLGEVHALYTFDDGTGGALFVGGQLGSAGGVAVGGIARWAGAWSALDEYCPGTVRRIVGGDLGDGPELYVAGDFPAWPGGDSHIARWACEDAGEVGVPYCSCDGSGAAAPCGNEGEPGEGCLNSSGVGGELRAEGSASVAADDLVFMSSGLIPNQPGLLFAGSQRVAGGAGVPFGDGLRCAGGTVRRLGVRTPDASGGASWGPGLAAAGGFVANETWHFQVWYRDAIGSPCGQDFNLTNGYEVELLP